MESSLFEGDISPLLIKIEDKNDYDEMQVDGENSSNIGCAPLPSTSYPDSQSPEFFIKIEEEDLDIEISELKYSQFFDDLPFSDPEDDKLRADTQSPELFYTSDEEEAEHKTLDVIDVSKPSIVFKVDDQTSKIFTQSEDEKVDESLVNRKQFLNANFTPLPSTSHPDAQSPDLLYKIDKEEMDVETCEVNEAQTSQVLDSSKDDVVKQQPKRGPKECPKCSANVLNISRHIRSVHGVSKEESRRLCFSIRKKRKGDFLGGKKCPYCVNSPPYARIRTHLMRIHNVSPTDKIFKTCPVQEKNVDSSDSKAGLSVSFSIFSEAESTKFYNYSRTLNGGKKGEISAKQYRYKIRQILNSTNVHCREDINDGTFEKSLLKWMSDYEKNHGNGSMITYLSVLASYLHYLYFEIATDKTKLRVLMQNINYWKSTYREEESKNRNNDNDGNDDDNFEITVKQLHQLEKSFIVRETITFLTSLKDKEMNLMPALQAQIRNVILMLIVMRNANKSSALYNMKLTNFYNALYINEHYVIETENSSSDIVMTKDIYEFVEIYINRIRNKLVDIGSNSPFVFVTKNGKKLTPGDMYMALNSMWKKAGNINSIGTAKIRQILATLMNSIDKENTHSGANHLSHKDTANSENINKVTMREEDNLHSFEKDSYANSPRECNIKLRSKNSDSNLSKNSNNSAASSLKKNNIELEDKNYNAHSSKKSNCKFGGKSSNSLDFYTDIYDIPRSSTAYKRRKGRKTFTEFEREVIQRAFKGLIISLLNSEKEIPKLSYIRETVKNNKLLSKIVLQKNYKDTQIKGCIINIINKARKYKSKFDFLF